MDGSEVDDITTEASLFRMSVLLSSVDVLPVCKLVVEVSVRIKLNGGDVVVEGAVCNDSSVVV